MPILKKGDVCSYHRLELPFKYGGLWRPEFETEELGSLLSKASVVVFNRYVGKDIIHLLRAKKKYGFKIVVDLDDYFELYPNHVAAKGWNEWNMAQHIRESLMNSDFVITTTSRLANIVKQFNKNVEVIPNALPFDDGQFVGKRFLTEGKIKFASLGGKTHFYDLLQIRGCLRKLERFNKGQYEMILAGYDEKDTDGIWEKIERLIKGDNTENYRRVCRLLLDMYMDAFDLADVVLAPLEPNYFNSFKSNLRVLEAGCKEMPVIASDYPPYSDEPTDLLMLANTTNEWYDHAIHCIKNPSFVRERGIELGAYVRQNYDLRKINLLREQVFAHLQGA